MGVKTGLSTAQAATLPGATAVFLCQMQWRTARGCSWRAGGFRLKAMESMLGSCPSWAMGSILLRRPASAEWWRSMRAHFLERVFTDTEQAYASRSPKRYFEHLAGRFAAKEAVLKVLGTGWRGGIAWTDIEIRTEPSGQPKVFLSGECLRIATEQAITRWHVSISHIETHATASAIGLRDPERVT